MQTEAALMIDELGGTTAVARAIGAPVSTVHSWRKNGIPHWRKDALQKLASKKRASLSNRHSNLHSSKTGGAQ